METILKKGRVRIKRGPLMNFNDLPIEKQTIFINIKKMIENYFGKEKKVFVFGSYKHGYWDEFSDYDVILGAEHNCFELNKIINEKMGVKVNIIASNKDISQILIP